MAEHVPRLLPDYAESIGEYEQAVAAVSGQNAAGLQLEELIATEQVTTPWLITLTRERLASRQQADFQRAVGAYAALPIDELMRLRSENDSRFVEAENRLALIDRAEDVELIAARRDADALAELIADLRPELLDAIERETTRRRERLEAEKLRAQALDNELGNLLSMPIPNLIAADARHDITHEVEPEQATAGQQSNDGAAGDEREAMTDEQWLLRLREEMAAYEGLSIGRTISTVVVNHVGQVIPKAVLAGLIYGPDDERGVAKLGAHISLIENDQEGKSAPAAMLRVRGLVLQKSDFGIVAVPADTPPS